MVRALSKIPKQENGPVVAKAVPTALRDLTLSSSGGRSITHYDETTGVPLTREAVESQLSLGHTVVLLSEAYNRRLSRLQVMYGPTPYIMLAIPETAAYNRKRVNGCNYSTLTPQQAMPPHTARKSEIISSRGCVSSDE